LGKTGRDKLKRILFVCSGNVHRSQTAQEILKNTEGLETRSAGTLPLSPHVVSKELIEWANIVFVMEEDHKDAILQISPEAKNKIVVLGIPDRYLRNDPRLVEMLKDRLSPYFGRM
jgi:predicted protein tyrosine phosphatase